MRMVDKITITKNYLISFPSAFCKINNLENKQSVLIYFDKGAFRLGLEFKDDMDERGFKITRPHEGKNGGYITSRSFLPTFVGESTHKEVDMIETHQK